MPGYGRSASTSLNAPPIAFFVVFGLIVLSFFLIPLALIALVAVMIFGFAGLIAYDSALTVDTPVVVAAHSWRRAIAIEEFRHVKREDWCSNLPSGATVTARVSKDTGRRTKKAGSKTRSSVYAEWCTFELDTWETLREVTAEGAALEPPPSWPDVPAQTCSDLGCQRPSPAPVEAYTVDFQAKDQLLKCSFSEVDWRAKALGSAWILPIGGLGGAHCAELRAP